VAEGAAPQHASACIRLSAGYMLTAAILVTPSVWLVDERYAIQATCRYKARYARYVGARYASAKVGITLLEERQVDIDTAIY